MSTGYKWPTYDNRSGSRKVKNDQVNALNISDMTTSTTGPRTSSEINIRKLAKSVLEFNYDDNTPIPNQNVAPGNLDNREDQGNKSSMPSDPEDNKAANQNMQNKNSRTSTFMK